MSRGHPRLRLQHESADRWRPTIRRASMASKQRIKTFLWYDANAEQAVDFYVSIFKDSKKLEVARYGEAGPGPKGSVMTVEFELEGQRFIALNGGPHFKFNEAISISVECDTQEEIDEL